jgi:glycosyltransferase involved in cell wall biosynthesis
VNHMTFAPSATVVICTFNPRLPVLGRVLDALRRQTVPCERWELIVVDNNSDEPLAPCLDVSWHPHARILREERPGKTFALRHAQMESQSDLIVIVDDDNILAPNYLEESFRIAASYPFLGAWGGSSIGEFESPPPRWLKSYMTFIAVKECKELIWSNEYFCDSSTPIGAGMCIRKAVAQRYAEMLETNPARQILGRRGEQLSGSEDTDMALTAIDMGLGLGRFPQLILTHVIPQGRMTERYILRLAEETQISNYLLRAIRRRLYPPYFSGSLLRRTVKWLRLWTLPRMNRRITQALVRGQRKGRLLAAELLASSPPTASSVDRP